MPLIDKEGKGYERVEKESLVFSSDSKLFAYGACEAGICFIVLNGKEWKPYYYGLGDSLLFSPDSKYIGYGAMLFNKETKELEIWWIVEEVKE